jgi:hypothetical protein
MPLTPTFLCADCPWCGERNLAPVATPLRELEPWLESRCRSCRGGMRARSTWHVFACFALGFGLLSDVTVLLALDGHLALAAPVRAALTGAYALGFVGAMVALAAFLIANSHVLRGKPPVGREDGW